MSMSSEDQGHLSVEATYLCIIVYPFLLVLDPWTHTNLLDFNGNTFMHRSLYYLSFISFMLTLIERDKAFWRIFWSDFICAFCGYIEHCNISVISHFYVVLLFLMTNNIMPLVATIQSVNTYKKLLLWQSTIITLVTDNKLHVSLTRFSIS